MAKTVDVPLRDDSSRTVSLEDLRQAASALNEGMGVEAEVEIDGRHLVALPLLAAALQVSPSDLRPNLAYSALEKLGFVLSWPTRHVTAPSETQAQPWQEDGDDGSATDLTPRLAAKLQRQRGKWVAIHRGELLASETTLRSTRRVLAGREATVLFMPRADNTHEIDF